MVPGDDLRELRLPSLSVGDALRTTFHLYRRHFLTFALVMGIMAVPSVLITHELLPWHELPSIPEARLSRDVRIAYLMQALQALGINVLKFAAFEILIGFPLDVIATVPSIVVSANLLFGRPAGIVAAFREVLRRLVNLMIVLIVTVAALILPGCTIIGLMAVPYIVLGLTFAWHTALLEQLGPIAAICRSWQLVKGQRWRIFICSLLLSVLTWVAISWPVHLLHWWTGVSHDSPLLGEGGLFGADPTTQAVWIADQTIYVVGQTVLFSLICILTTVLYFDLRAREAPAGPPKPLDLPSG